MSTEELLRISSGNEFHNDYLGAHTAKDRSIDRACLALRARLALALARLEKRKTNNACSAG